jgi:hypothetical protein
MFFGKVANACHEVHPQRLWNALQRNWSGHFLDIGNARTAQIFSEATNASLSELLRLDFRKNGGVCEKVAASVL